MASWVKSCVVVNQGSFYPVHQVSRVDYNFLSNFVDLYPIVLSDISHLLWIPFTLVAIPMQVIHVWH